MESYHSIPLEKSDVRGRHSLLVAHTLTSIHFEPTFRAPDSPFPGSPSLYVPTLNESTNDRYPSPMEEPNLKDRLIRWENLSSLSTTPHSCVEPMWDRIIPYPLRNQMSVDDIYSGWLTLWLAFTSNPSLRHQVALSQVALSRYVPALNESTNDRYSSPMEEPNPKDQPIRWENPSSLSTTPHSCVEPM